MYPINYQQNKREESKKSPQADTVDQVLLLITVFTVIFSHRSG